MTTMAQIAGLTLALAVGGDSRPPVTKEVATVAPPELAKGRVVSVRSSKGAPLFTAFWVKGKAPQLGQDYEECTGSCDPVTYKVTFGKDGKPECPLAVESSVQNCKSDDPAEKKSCTATKRKLRIKFLQGAFPYQVRFSPFGEPLLVEGGDSKAMPVHGEAAIAWYKFTVDSPLQTCEGVEAVDPNVIVTN